MQVWRTADKVSSSLEVGRGVDSSFLWNVTQGFGWILWTR